MVRGLDIGPDAIRSAAGETDAPTIESEPTVAVPVEEATLESVDHPKELHTIDGNDDTYAVGSSATTVVEAIGEDAAERPLLADGILRPETDAEATLGAILESLLGDGSGDGDGTVDRVRYATPEPRPTDPAPVADHRDTVAAVLAERGIEAAPIGKGFAVVYDQLGSDNYTGIGICLGRQHTSFSLAYYGVPSLSVSIPRGRDWVVERAASETDRSPAAVADVLATFELDPEATGDVESAIAGAYDDLIGDLIDAVVDSAEEGSVQDGVAVPIAIAGPGAVEGLEFLVGGRFDAGGLGASIRGVRLADEPTESVVRGALAAARDDDFAGDEGGIRDLEADVESDEPRVAATDDDGETRLSFDEGADRGDEGERGGGNGTDPATDLLENLSERFPDEDDLRSIEAELDGVHEDLEGLEERTASQETVGALEERVTTLADEVADLERRATSDEDDVEALGDDIAELSARVDAIEEDVDDLTIDVAEFGGLPSTVEDLEEDLAELSDDLTDLTETSADDRDRIREDLDSIRDEQESAVVDIETLEERLEAVAADLDDLQAERERREEPALASDVEALEERLEDRLEAATADLESLAEDVAGLEDRTDEIDTVESRLSDLGARVDDLGGRIERLEELEGRVDDLETLEGRVDDLEGIGTDVASLDDRLEERGSEIDALEGRIDDLDSVEERLEELAELRERIDGLADRTARVDDLEDLEERLDELADLGETVADLEEELGDLTDLDETVADLEAQLEELADLDTIVADLEDLEDEVDAAGDLERRVDALEGLEDRIVDPERVERLEERIDARGDRDPTVDDLADRLETQNARIDGVSGRTEEFAERLDALESARDDDPEGLADRLDDLESSLGTVETRVQGLEADDEEDEAVAEDGSIAESDLTAATLAGGGGAGLVAGAVVALAGDGTVGAAAAAVGILLLGVAVVTGR